MIEYGKMLKAREKDNPSHMLRATYLFSNVGDLIKCWGRMKRFPENAKAYKAEIELAIGDIIMQCRLIEYEREIRPIQMYECSYMDEDTAIASIAHWSGMIVDMLKRMGNKKYDENNNKIQIHYHTLPSMLDGLLSCINELCIHLHISMDAMEHQGFFHVMERYEQFKEEGW